ncbi:hypothetical protein BpPP18_31490 [Weizmannia acidilactici]|nr:Ig-like domain-containing protein [Weizmannia acidilactici]GER75082.1 hypothetical protein BpPP18_31490 [Weizmannia acidilactici]
MKKIKNMLKLLFVLALIFGLPVGVYANGSTSTDQQNARNTISLQSKIIQGAKPNYVDKSGSQSYLNPDDYPLINPGGYVGALTDSWYSTHYLTYGSTTSYSDTQMLFTLLHTDTDYYKDPYLEIEFYTNHNGTMDFVGYFEKDISAYTGTVSLGFIINKSFFQNDPYIYVRVGTLSSLSDYYYSDVTYFKVANPFYQGGTPTTGSNYYELISNESTDGNATESTGSFAIQNDEYASSKNLSRSAYQMDYVVPFDTKKYESRSLKKSTKSIQANYQVGDSKSFYVQNLVTGAYSSMSATLLYSGSHADVWVNNNEITSDEAAQLGKEFDNKIYSSDVDNFGSPSDIDQNGKVNILCYDIQDGFSGSGGYVAGYFSPQDLYNVSYSNRSEIFYIDTYPLMGIGSSKDVSQAYSTLAHEFQHMINFNQKVFVQGLTDTDTWMDEGLSMAAEQIYTGEALQDRIDYYNEDSDITNGHSLLYWDYDGDVLANYSLSYLFMEYLKDQCGRGNSIFKELINDPHSDYQAVQDIIHKYVGENISFGQFMTDFRAALVLKQDTGLYGFKGDSAFDGLNIKTYSGSSLNLKGGGAVVKSLGSKDDFSVPADKGQDITYTLLDAGGGNATAPATPVVNEVGDSDTTVTGTADPNVTVSVAVNGTVIGSSVSGSSGNFSVTIPKQKAGTELHVYAVDSNGNKSGEAVVTVKDKTAPAAPVLNNVSDADTSVTGTAEVGAKITVKANHAVISTGYATSSGTFAIAISKQRAGTQLSAYAEDAAGNMSPETTVTVIDKTAPSAPRVNPVSDADTTVTGTTEAGAKVTVQSGLAVLGTATADSTGAFKAGIAKQKAGTKLTVYAQDAAGNKSAGTTVTVSDKTAPAAPKVNSVTDASTTVTGTTEAGAKVTVQSGSAILGTDTADSKGSFKVTIAKQKAGTKLTVYAQDVAGNKSAGTTVTVIDKTAPAIPKVNTISDATTYVTGTTEANAAVTIKRGSTTIGTGIADSKGNFKIKIAKQKAGTKLVVYAKDAAGNTSAGASVTVIDKTAPAAPTVYTFGDNQTTVTGKAEAGAKVTIKSGKTVLGYGYASSKGTFSVKIKSKQKAGTTLTAYATDKAGNTSTGRSFKVVDKTPPATPTAGTVTYKSTTVSGKAEKYATVYVYNGSHYVGKATVSSKGTYTVHMKKQKKGSTLKIYAKDKAGNKSGYRYVKVK